MKDNEIQGVSPRFLSTWTTRREEERRSFDALLVLTLKYVLNWVIISNTGANLQKRWLKEEGVPMV